VHEPFITVVGNLAAPPTLRSLTNGTPVASFRIASTPRKLDKASGEWGDGQTIWFGVAAWRALGEHCAESLKKGDKVVVSGRLVAHTWLDPEGKERSGLEIDAQSVGLDLSRGAATMLKTVAPTVTEDPWASSGEVDPETGEVLGGPAPREPVTGEREDVAA
jgi:single-strand DNA-binding protein